MFCVVHENMAHQLEKEHLVMFYHTDKIKGICTFYIAML